LLVSLYGIDRSRTDDLLRVKQALFQLSYDPERMVSRVYINRPFGTLSNLAMFFSLPPFNGSRFAGLVYLLRGDSNKNHEKHPLADG
jgi:hypothetical protein